MNISGILVQVKPDKTEEIVRQIQSEDLWEYHLHDDKGRIIVTIEGKNAEEEMQKLNRLKRLDYVIAADMVYSYSEDELNSLRENVEKEVKIPEWLNDPNIRAEQIRYNGDLKKKY